MEKFNILPGDLDVGPVFCGNRRSLTITLPCCRGRRFYSRRSYYTLPYCRSKIERCIIANMNLSIVQALRVDSSPCIAFIGAGGKTTALFQLARTLSRENASSVIVIATSHLGAWQFGLADQHIMTDSPAPLEELEHGLQGVVLVTGEMDGDRSKPINESLLNWLHQF